MSFGCKTIRQQLSPVLGTGLVALAMFVCCASAWGQQDGARRLTGTVSDQSGAPVPRVAVEIRTSSGQHAASAFTDSQGRFAVSLPDGRYTLDATAAGLAPIRRQPLEIDLEHTAVTLKLEIPAIEQLIVVTATRTEAPVSQIGSSTTVLHGDDLASAGIVSMAEALRSAAGLTIVQNGASGQLASLFLRGGESDYAKVLIDGIPVNDPGGSFNFANMSISAIDRIEIVRGPQSALYGSDAMAGIIQVFTRRGNHEGLEPQPSLAVEAGSFSTFRYQAGISGQGHGFDYSASFARLDTDNDVQNGSYNNATTTLNVGLQPTQGSRLRVVVRSSAGRAGIPGQWAFHRPDPDEFYRHRTVSGGLNFTQFIRPGWTQVFSYAMSDARQYSEDPSDSGSFIAEYQGRQSPYASYDFPFQTLNQSRRQSFAYRSDWSLPDAHLLTAGAEYERESGTVGDPRYDPLRAVRNNFGFFLQDQWFFHRKFFAAAGLRLEKNASFGFSAAPRVSLAWQARQPDAGAYFGLTKIKANFGLGIKEPTLVESFSKSPYFLGNPALKPEKSASFDVGIEQQIRNGRGSFELTYFENRFRNQIDFVTTDTTTFSGTFFNTGKTRARGIEAQLRRDLPANVTIAGSYTFLDSLILENPAAFDAAFAPGQPLFRRPRHSGHIDVQWKPGRWILGAACPWMGSRSDSDFLGLGLSRNPGYAVLDLNARYRWFGNVSVFAAVNNVLNHEYMESFGYPALRARFRIGLSTGF